MIIIIIIITVVIACNTVFLCPFLQKYLISFWLHGILLLNFTQIIKKC